MTQSSWSLTHDDNESSLQSVSSRSTCSFVLCRRLCGGVWAALAGRVFDGRVWRGFGRGGGGKFEEQVDAGRVGVVGGNVLHGCGVGGGREKTTRAGACKWSSRAYGRVEWPAGIFSRHRLPSSKSRTRI